MDTIYKCESLKIKKSFGTRRGKGKPMLVQCFIKKSFQLSERFVVHIICLIVYVYLLNMLLLISQAAVMASPFTQ